jgi:hypothetical protein
MGWLQQSYLTTLYPKRKLHAEYVSIPKKHHTRHNIVTLYTQCCLAKCPKTIKNHPDKHLETHAHKPRFYSKVRGTNLRVEIIPLHEHQFEFFEAAPHHDVQELAVLLFVRGNFADESDVDLVMLILQGGRIIQLKR